MTKHKKTWAEKLAHDGDLPKVVKLTGKDAQRWGGKTLAIPRPRDVDALMKKVPKGKVTTYKELAKAVHSKAYRAVGTAMKMNRDPTHIHCYRVVRSDGFVGRYSAPGGTARKAALLKVDGIEIKNGKIDLRRYIYRFR